MNELHKRLKSFTYAWKAQKRYENKRSKERSKENYNKEELKKLFFKLGMKSLLAKLPGDDLEGEEEVAKIEINEVTTIEGFKEVLSVKEGIAFISYSTCNANLYSKIELDKLYINYGDKVSLIDFKLINMENSNEAINLLKAFMEDEKIEKVIQGLPESYLSIYCRNQLMW